ncbi:hypothetical protein XMV225_000824 [Aliiroseovarius sp. xm-v-225]|nr:hypothetical protein [Aliiroseovarius sp. xm-m-378]NRP64539.1 hypothetical protein [Aliiroseovarius sp. xm-v-225]NRP92296.1 hypothetical protein [Aliiroseovarius sp. xm-a-134]
MNSRFLGSRWLKKPESLHCEWIAYPESRKSDPHWHLLFRISHDLTQARIDKILDTRGSAGNNTLEGLSWLAHECWNGVIRSGTSRVVLKENSKGLGSYAAKEQFDQINYENFVISREFKS